MSEFRPEQEELVPVLEDSSIQDLDNAILRQRERLESIDSENPDRAYMLDQESVAWYWRYQQSRNRGDIEQAVRTSQAAVQAMKPGDQDRSAILSHLSTWLHRKFRETHNPEDFVAALLNARLALETVDLGSERWLELHYNMTAIFTEQVRISPSLEMLEEAIKLDLEGINTQQPNHKYASRYFSSLTWLFRERYKQSMAIHDLEEAIKYGYQAVEMLRYAKTAKLEYSNLSGALLTHYQTTYLFSSLAEGLRISRLGLDNEIYDARNLAIAFSNHGSLLEAKFQRHRETNPIEAMKDLEEAINGGYTVLERLDDLADIKSQLLNLMGAWLGTKMKMAKDLTFGEEGARLLYRALELTPYMPAQRPIILSNLVHIHEVQSQILAARGQKQAALEMLSKAITYGYEAVSITEDEDPLLEERRKNLGVMLFSKHVLTEDDAPYREAKKYLTLTARTETAPPLTRIISAIQAAISCHEEGEVAEADELIQAGVSLLQTLNRHSISIQDLQQTLGQVTGLATYAASIALEAGHSPYEALKPLEAARCLIAEVSMSSKIDISKLRKDAPELANKYDDLRTQLAQASQQLKLPGTYRDARRHQQELLQAVSDAEVDIRKLRGWESFQRPMSEENIKDLATDGPIIVVNATRMRCDAIVVSAKDIKLIRLPDMKYKDLERNIILFNGIGNESRRNAVPRQKKTPIETISDALLWLWKVAVRPILDGTELTSSRRVWWITTGLAGRAPFHAAGDHSPGSQDNALSRVISSYISSFKALRFSRDKRLASISKRSMLLVTMSWNPPPHHNLDTSYEEQVAKEIFGDCMEHLPQPDPETVLRRLPEFSLVHFACHGSSIAYDPSQSGLLLVRRGKAAQLKISDLEEVTLKEGAIVYLSACSTAEQADGKLVDEAIHLANSFQALGFQHVIGTMWGADDRAAGEVARKFYKRLFAGAEAQEGNNICHLDVAESLHEAIVDFRNTEQKQNCLFNWCPFVHVGI